MCCYARPMNRTVILIIEYVIVRELVFDIRQNYIIQNFHIFLTVKSAINPKKWAQTSSRHSKDRKRSSARLCIGQNIKFFKRCLYTNRSPNKCSDRMSGLKSCLVYEHCIMPFIKIRKILCKINSYSPVSCT